MKIWKEIKLQIRLFQRVLRDLRKGTRRQFARIGDSGKPDFRHSISLSQPIRSSATLENKLVNIRLACTRIGPVTVYPGQVFSFWNIVGKPSATNGFRRSRNIIDGQLSEDVGGGLCQVSGILYHLALLTGLKVTERHAHSLDIYQEEERHTPLGADATVVFGYKDLRLANPYSFPVAFSFEISDNQLICTLLSDVLIEKKTVEFRRTIVDGYEKVTTILMSDSSEKVIAESQYDKITPKPD